MAYSQECTQRCAFYCSYVGAPICKFIISTFIALQMDTQQDIYKYIWCSTVIIAVTIYCIISTMFIYLKHISKEPYTKDTRIIDTSFDSIIKLERDETPFTSSKLLGRVLIVYMILLELGVLLHIIAWVTSDTYSYFFLLSFVCIIPYSIMDTYFNKIYYESVLNFNSNDATAMAVAPNLLLIVWMFWVTLKYHFGPDIHDLVLIISFILVLMKSEIKSSMLWSYYPKHMHHFLGRRYLKSRQLRYFKIPKCCEIVLYLTFLILFCVFYYQKNINIIFAFIPLWLMWCLQFGQGFFKYLETYSKYMTNQLKHEIIRDRLDNYDLLGKINEGLEKKINDVNKLYRSREKYLILDIISPNHVALTRERMNVCNTLCQFK